MNKLFNSLCALVYLGYIAYSVSNLSNLSDSDYDASLVYMLIILIPMFLHLSLNSKPLTKLHKTFLSMTGIFFVAFTLITIYMQNNQDYGNYGLGNAIYLGLPLMFFWFVTIGVGISAKRSMKKV